MAPPSMPELLDILSENPTPITEREASEYLAPTAPYLNALAAQVRPRPDEGLNHVIKRDKQRLLFWFTHDRPSFQLRKSLPCAYQQLSIQQHQSKRR